MLVNAWLAKVAEVIVEARDELIDDVYQFSSPLWICSSNSV